jgi:hypothetical protein
MLREADGRSISNIRIRSRSPLVLPPQCYFSRPDTSGRYISILTGPRTADAGLTRLSISEHG